MKKTFTLLFALCMGVFMSFNTQAAALPVIDISNDTDPGSLETTLNGLTDGAQIILNPAVSYTFSQVSYIGYDVHIDGGTGAMPTINLKNFDVIDGSTLSLIKLSNIKIVGIDASADYMVNISTACSVTDIIFEGCEISNLRGGIRIKNSNVVSITNVLISDCMLDNFGSAGNGYGLLNIDNANAVVTNTKVEKSTLTNIDKFFLIGKGTTNLGSLMLVDCTFNNCLASGRYIADMKSKDGNTYDYTNGVTVTNCIFGVTPVANNKAYIRVLTASLVTYTNVYKTTEATDMTMLRTTAEGIVEYAGSSSALFTDAAAGNYLLTDAAFAGATSAGDPRWYYGTTAISSPKESSANVYVAGDQLIFSEMMVSVNVYSITGVQLASYTNAKDISISDLQRGLFVVSAKDQQGLILVDKFVK